MQIDFHLGATYVLARLSGFSPFEANTIASASQYVDDAIHSGTVFFNNRSAYSFTASAHRMLDYRNWEQLSNHHVWIPFHFIPGNHVQESTVDPLVQKLICRPNSPIAQEIVQSCIQQFSRPYGYHLLGVTTHAFVDTWAHQGFAGITHAVNKVSEIYDEDGSLDHEMMDYRKKYYSRNFFRKIFDKLRSYFVGEGNPIGHGTVLSYPDLPYLRWAYKDWEGKVIHRDNPSDYMSAIHHVLEFYKDLRLQHGLPIVKIQQSDLDQLRHLIENVDHEEGEDRLAAWRDAIKGYKFSFGMDVWTYSVEGNDSWLKEAFDFDTVEDFEFDNITYKESFLKSNWKMMHDALLFYRFSVLHEVLPRHQICMA